MDYNLQNNIVNTYHTDYKFFFSKPNVAGIGLGYKYTNGICTCEPSIHVFVNKKLANNCLQTKAIIPSLYKGIKTDIIETGYFSSNINTNINNSCTSAFINSQSKNSPYSYTQRIRPIQSGYCMSIVGASLTGTLGYIVIDNEQISKTYCLLSNNSTFSNFNQAQIGTKIIQPSYSFGGESPQDVVAKLLKFSPLKFSPTLPNNLRDFNTIDASIASYFTVGEVQLINPFIPNIGVPNGITPPSLNLPIKWTGCLLGTQCGIINSLKAIIKVSYANDKTAWFQDIFISTGNSCSQDLGALVCDNTTHALGLLFGRSSEGYVNICTINNITSSLKVTLLTL